MNTIYNLSQEPINPATRTYLEECGECGQCGGTDIQTDGYNAECADCGTTLMIPGVEYTPIQIVTVKPWDVKTMSFIKRFMIWWDYAWDL